MWFELISIVQCLLYHAATLQHQVNDCCQNTQDCFHFRGSIRSSRSRSRGRNRGIVRATGQRVTSLVSLAFRKEEKKWYQTQSPNRGERKPSVCTSLPSTGTRRPGSGKSELQIRLDRSRRNRQWFGSMHLRESRGRFCFHHCPQRLAHRDRHQGSSHLCTTCNVAVEAANPSKQEMSIPCCNEDFGETIRFYESFSATIARFLPHQTRGRSVNIPNRKHQHHPRPPPLMR